MSAAPLRLTARSLACRRGDRPVFEDVSFDVASGQMLTITGPNGAGKSSLLRIVAGLLGPTSGSLQLEGAEADRSIGEHAHYAGHSDAVKPTLGVGENLAFWAALYGSPFLPPVEALALLGIEHLAEVPAGILSAGQRRRLALARLLVSRRPIWVLDEPTSTLDKGAQAEFAVLMGRHLSEGGLILAATHADLGLEGQRQIVLGG